MKLELSQYLDDLRRRHGLASDAALCARTGLSKFHISRMRTGEQLMGPAVLLKIHEAFGDSVESIRELLAPDAFTPDALPSAGSENAPRAIYAAKVPADDVYAFIRNRIEGTGRAPTLQEIADQFKFASANTAQGYVQRLVELGKLKRAPGSRRGITLVDSA